MCCLFIKAKLLSLDIFSMTHALLGKEFVFIGWVVITFQNDCTSSVVFCIEALLLATRYGETVMLFF